MRMRHCLAILWLGLAAVPCPAALAQDKPTGTDPAAIQDAERARPSTFAETKPAQVWASLDGTVIHLVGPLGPGSFGKFMEVARRSPKARTVYLASPGGIVIEGYLISNALRVRKYDTWVEMLCASACTQIFAAGNQRLLGNDARLGFHQSFAEDAESGKLIGSDYARDEDLAAAISTGDRFDPLRGGDDKVVRSLRRAGVSENFIGKVLRTPPGQFWYPDRAELLSEGMVTRFVGPEAGLTVPPGTKTREELDAELSAYPFWRILRVREPALFETALHNIWRETNSGLKRSDSEDGAKSVIFQALSKQAASAPDAILDRLVIAYADQARDQRQAGYPMCTDQLLPRGSLIESSSRFRAGMFEASFTAFLESTERVPPIPFEQARKTLRKNWHRLVAANIEFGEPTADKVEECKIGFRFDERFQDVDPRYRPQLFRAWLSAQE